MALTPEQITAFQLAREEKLLARWGDGARLNDKELAEIAHLIPQPRAAVAPPDPAPAPAPVLVLESPSPITPKRSACLHPIVPGSPYEVTYDATIRTIKRWRQCGLAATPPESPPLDSPWLMAIWWRKHMARVVPARLIQLEEQGAPAATITPPPTPITASAPPPPAAPAVAPLAPPITDSTLKIGYAATLERFQQAEALAAERYFAAFSSSDPAVRDTAAALKREWNDMADTMRAYERDAAKILSASGNLWDAAQVIETVTTLHTVIFAGIRRLHRRMRQLHPDAHLLTTAQQDALWDAQVDVLVNTLNNSNYTSATLPAPEPDFVVDNSVSPLTDATAA